MTKYKFSDKYECVYRLCESAGAYFFMGSYATFGLKKGLTEDVARDIVEYKLAHCGQEVRL